MIWVLPGIAGLPEVAWTGAVKLSEGFPRLWPSVLTFVLVCLGFWRITMIDAGTLGFKLAET